MSAPGSPGRGYRARRDWARPSVLSKYSILGFISSGTYGRVYKARVRLASAGSQSAAHTPQGVMVNTPVGAVSTPGKKRPVREGEEEGELVAIKKFKPDKEGELVTYTGISQSACREIMINREISHEHVTALKEVMLEEKSIYLVFEYAEHDLLQIIHHHSSTRTTIPLLTLKSLLFQLFNGVAYLHDNWVVHRDLKPANILVNSAGVVKIGDLGLARVYQDPLQSLYASDKIVVTVWYRAPELLLGARHYTPAIDLWSIGCIIGELVGLRPMFKGEEAKIELGVAAGGKKGGVPFQKDQMGRVLEVVGTIDKEQWPGVTQMPEFHQLARFDRYNPTLSHWLQTRWQARYPLHLACDLLTALLTYDPAKRITARDSLIHLWWAEEPTPNANAFLGLPPGVSYPPRRVTHDEADFKGGMSGITKQLGTGVAGFASAGPSGMGLQAPRNKRTRLE